MWCFNNFLQWFARRGTAKLSFSQSGEDLIVDFIFCALRIEKPTYLDIGANEPRKLSNTFHFYLRGCRGVLIEPDPSLYSMLLKDRPKDTILRVGVAANEMENRQLFIMSTPTLNTFSEDEAKRYELTGMHKIVRTEYMPVISANQVFQQHFSGCAPDFLTLDVEGLDFEIINSINFSKYRPIVICVETLTFTENNTEEKITSIIELLESEGYLAYADTYINTIFVDRKKWQARI